jgi:hypothetical protein
MLSELASTTVTASDSPLLMILSFLYPVVLFGLIGLVWWRRRKKYGGPPKFSGPPLAGTARITYVVATQNPRNTSWNRSHPPIRNIYLLVNIPGHAPYKAVATQEVPAPVSKGLHYKQGKTVAVQVDSNDCSYVRIDFTKPIT